MSDVAIRVENLGKAYRIGTAERRHETLFGAAAAFVKSPITNFQNLRRLSRFDTFDDADVLWALKDVSVEIKHGDVVGIIGRNGAGKSTLLKILSHITEPTHGQATIFGRVGSLLEVGTGFHPDLTGRENIYLNGTILGMRKREIDHKFDAIMDFAGVEKFVDTPVKRYSSGMRVRLAFAVAAHLEPEILIVDEVLAVGDAAFQRKCLGKMKDVAGNGRTVLFVSHNIVAVEQLCNTGIVMDAGRATWFSSAHEAIVHYERQIARTNGQGQGGRCTGDGTVVIDTVELLNEEGTAQPLPGPFEDLLVRIHYTANQLVPSPAFGVEISSMSGILMLSVNSMELGLQLPPLEPGTGTMEIRVHKLPYVPGLYDASVWIMSTPKPVHARMQELKLEIRQKPVYGTRELNEQYGCVLSKLDFKLLPSQSRAG